MTCIADVIDDCEIVTAVLAVVLLVMYGSDFIENDVVLHLGLVACAAVMGVDQFYERVIAGE